MLSVDYHTASVGHCDRLTVPAGRRSVGADAGWSDCRLSANAGGRHRRTAAAAATDSNHPDTEPWYAPRVLILAIITQLIP